MKFTSLQIRVSDDEKKIIRDYFDEHSLNLSDWVRKRIFEEIKREGKK